MHSQAPARIIQRRNTAAVDENVELHQVVDLAVQQIEQVPIRPARIVFRRNTAAVDKISELDMNSLEKMPFRNANQLVQVDECVPLVLNMIREELTTAQVVNILDQPLDLSVKSVMVTATKFHKRIVHLTQINRCILMYR